MTTPDARHLDAAFMLWRREVAKGVRKVDTMDTLAMAAQWESSARDLDALDCWETAARCRATARQLILDVAGKRVAA